MEASLVGMPPEVIRNMTSFMKPRVILNLCETSKQFNEFCKDDNLWSEIIQRDFGKSVPKSGSTWKDTYIALNANKFRLVEVRNKGIVKGKMWIENSQTGKSIVEEAGNIASVFPKYVYGIIDTGGVFNIWHEGGPLDHPYFQSLVALEVTEEAAAPLQIISESGARKMILLHASTTLGYLFDEMKKFVPTATIFTIWRQGMLGGRVNDDYYISDDPSIRDRNANQSLYAVGYKSATGIYIK